MPSKTLLNTPDLTNERSLKTLVENRTVFTLENCELNIFETYQKSNLVPLKFNDLVVTSMLRGKKVMHLFDEPGFDYLPGETVVIPASEEMKIDFPEAKNNNPTQCLALAIDQAKITETLNLLNEKYPKEGKNQVWQLNSENYFFYNNLDLAATINKLVKECMSTHITKDAIADLTLQELLIRIIQSQSNKSIEQGNYIDLDSPIQHVVEYIHNNLNEKIQLKNLSEKAGMSNTTFYRYFKRELGMSPIEFVLNEKIKCAKQLLRDQGLQINEVGYLSGFEDCNYFIRLFKKHEGITPKQYQMLYIN
jgi:AraC-like DNA-binding protein